MANYGDLLKDPRWQKKRLETFQRDNWTCTDCPNGLLSGKELHAHHRYYITGRAPWDYPEEAIITLCDECHSKVHGKVIRPTYDIVAIGKSIGQSVRALRGLMLKELEATEEKEGTNG